MSIPRVTAALGVLACMAGVGVMLDPPRAGAAAAAQRFVIVPADSIVTCRVAETLFREGNRLNVAVGTTSAVRGEIVVDRAAPRNSRIGTITVDISTDFGFEPPSILGILRAENEVRLEFRFVARPAL